METTELSMLDKEWKHLLLVNSFGVNEIETKLNILNQEYQFLHDYNPIDRVQSRVKSQQNIIKKLIKLGQEPTVENAYKYLHDIGGVRVICSFSKDIYTIASLLQSQSDINVIKIKDYMRTPKPNGYRSLHVLVEVPVFMSNTIKPVTVEVQFRSASMDLWASIEHKIYYKKGLTVPQELTDRITACAERLDKIDQELGEIKAEIDGMAAAAASE